MPNSIFLLQKEFIQIFRNKAMLAIIIVLPVVQLLLLAYATNYEIKNIAIDVVDQDHSVWSRQLTNKLSSSGYFQIVGRRQDVHTAMEDITTDHADLILVIPSHFARNLIRENHQEVQLLINGINGMKAGISAGYLQTIIKDFNQHILDEGINNRVGVARISQSYWYNPHMDYKPFMVPGILVVLVTMIGAFLAAMNVVREKEIGTMEQLNVTPIGKQQFIIGKLLPIWVIAMAELAFGLLFAMWVFQLSFAGSIGLIFLFAAIYLLVMLGMGLLISTRTNTQQQAMFITWFFFVVFLLLSGLFTPVSSMPEWAQDLTWLNPVAWFIKVIRMVLQKGSGWTDVRPYFIIIATFAIMVNGIAVLAYRKIG